MNTKQDLTKSIIKCKCDDWHFNEGTTKVVTICGPPKKIAPAPTTSVAKVKGGVKRTLKAKDKSVGVSKDIAKSKTVEKVLKFTPGKKN